jgi:phenylacetate-CoA ligase
MKSILENIYLKLPVFVQNIILTVYGYRIQRIRYRGNYDNQIKNANCRLTYSKHKLEDYVNTKLREIIIEAFENVPYYRETLKKHNIEVNKIRTIDDFLKVPLLEKEDIRKNPLHLVSKKYNNKRLIGIHTTGTTGAPLKIYCDKATRQLNYAYYDRFLAQVGINYSGRRATFGGRIIVPPEQRKPPFWRYSLLQKNLLFSSYHLIDKNIPHYIAKLKRFKPDIIDAYPSSLYTVALYAKMHNIGMNNVTKGITTSAETLFPEQREIIESIFGVPIYDQYGAAEMCVFLGQCKQYRYHIHSDYALVEILRPDGTRALPGEEGEIVCTGFINPVMPLIRYRIGDRAVLWDHRCDCGSDFPVVTKILGRIDDVIITPDGRRVGRLSPVLKGFPVKEAQYVQNSIHEIQVLIVKANRFNPQTEKALTYELRKRLGTQIKINYKYLSRIPRGKGGKLRSIISNVPA